jgi:hypothetical protein
MNEIKRNAVLKYYNYSVKQRDLGWTEMFLLPPTMHGPGPVVQDHSLLNQSLLSMGQNSMPLS